MEVLLVEDEDDHATLARRALERNDGWAVHRVRKTADALDLVGDVDLDLAVIDHQLPDGDGLSLLKRLRARLPNLPVLFVTGVGSEELALEALRHGAVDYLTKGPGLPDRLALRAEEVLTGWPGGGPLVQVSSTDTNDASEASTRSRSEDLDGNAIQEELAAIISAPVQGGLVVDRSGRTLAVDLPDELEPSTLGPVLEQVHRAVGRLRKAEALSPRRYGLVVETSGHLVAVSAAPGPLLVGLVLQPSAGSMIGLRQAQEAARRIWEAS